MRELNIGTTRYTKVICLDEPGVGNACHKYAIFPVDSSTSKEVSGCFAQIDFQNGAVQEAGVNGCQNEDLLVIVIDRLQGFQSGDFKCRENALAITKIEEALHWLNHRTAERKKRGVEGKQII